MLNKTAISPVVATALLLVVGVTAVIGFQNFFGSFSSGLFSNVETENSVDKRLRIEGIFTDMLYLKSGDDTNLSLLKIVDSSGNEMCSFSGNGEVNSSELIGWWKLNDENSTIVDLSGNGNNGKLYGNTRLLLDFNDEIATDRTSYNNTGTLMNGVDCTVTGVNGKGCTFDGVNDYIQFEENKTLLNLPNSTSFTISAWIKDNHINNNTWGTVISTYRNGAPTGWNLRTFSDANSTQRYFRFDVVFGWGAGGTSTIVDTIPGSVPFNQWAYVVAVYNLENKSADIYINGERAIYNTKINGSGIYNDELSFGSGEHTIGRIGHASVQLFNGSIDEVAIYSKALSQEEITDLYNSEKAKFVEFKDSKLDKSVEFDGVDDYIQIPNSSSKNLIEHFTICANLKLSSNKQYQEIVSKRAWNAPLHADFPFGMYYYGTTNTYAYFLSKGNDYSADDLINYNDSNLNDKRYCVLYSANNFSKAYLNNNLIDEHSINFTINNTNYNWTFGRSAYRINTDNFFHGQIDEVRIYNRTLSDDEINSLYLYSFKPIEAGINEIDVTSCNLAIGEYYDVVAFSDKNRVEMKVIAK